MSFKSTEVSKVGDIHPKGSQDDPLMWQENIRSLFIHIICIPFLGNIFYKVHNRCVQWSMCISDLLLQNDHSKT